MILENRRISCEVRKAIQEERFEPFEITMSVSGDIPDSANLENELEKLSKFLENKIEERINRHVR